jgi:hypothetical protein
MIGTYSLFHAGTRHCSVDSVCQVDSWHEAQMIGGHENLHGVGEYGKKCFDDSFVEVNVGGPCSQTYPGSAPFSEREVAEVTAYMAGIEDLQGVLAIHSYGQMYMVAYGYTNDPNPDFDEQVSGDFNRRRFLLVV